MASDNDSGFWKARFLVLYQKSLDLLPRLENTFNTPELEDWVNLMRRLIKEDNYGR